MNKKQIINLGKKLNLKYHTIIDVIFLYEKFSTSNTHQFSQEIMISTSIFIAGKLHEEQVRIRDIINVVYFEKKRQKIISENNSEEKEYIENLIKEDYTENQTIIHTMYNISLDNYIILKNDILSAEQHLLRVLNYNLKKKINSYFIFCELISHCENGFKAQNVKNSGLNDIVKMCFDVLKKIVENEGVTIESIFSNKNYYILGIIECCYHIFLEITKTKPQEAVDNYIIQLKKDFSIEDELYNKIIKQIIEIV